MAYKAGEPGPHTPSGKSRQVDLDAHCWNMHLEGKTCREIADVLNIGKSTVQRHIERALQASVSQNQKSVDEFRVMELARLERLWSRLWGRMAACEHDPAAYSSLAGRLLQLSKRVARLRGLDAPTKVAPTDPTGEKEYGVGLTDDERRAELARILGFGTARQGAG